MKIEVIRYNSTKDHTNSIILINGKFECYALEDEYRVNKVKGHTRIPNGTYNVTLRDFGGKHQHYKKKYGSAWHKGMLWIREVPNFKYVLIHIGNTDKDTDACLIVGDTQARGENFIGQSAIAYKRMYPKVRNALLRNEKVTIEYKTIT